MFFRFYSNIGFVKTVSDGIVTIVGLSSVRYGEMVTFSNAGVGVVLSLENRSASAIVLGSDVNILPGDFVFRTSKLMGVSVNGSLLGTIINPLGKNLSKKKSIILNKNNKYLNFKKFFSIFLLDHYSFKNLLICDTNLNVLNNIPFNLCTKSLIKERYMLGFMADYNKFLNIKKTFFFSKDVKEFFKLSESSFIKTIYRNKKLLNMVYDYKIKSSRFLRWKNIRAFQLKFKKEKGLILSITNLDKNDFSDFRVKNFFLNFRENLKKTEIKEKNTKKLLIFNRLLETRAPSIISRSSVNLSLETGIKVIDSMVPIGHGQRELILVMQKQVKLL